MANRKQPERWESLMLAGAMATAGTLFAFDKLGSLVHTGLLSFATILHAGPLLLIVAGISLMVADQNLGAVANDGRSKRSL